MYCLVPRHSCTWVYEAIIYFSTLSAWADLLDNGGCFVVVVCNGSELDWNEILLVYQCIRLCQTSDACHERLQGWHVYLDLQWLTVFF